MVPGSGAEAMATAMLLQMLLRAVATIMLVGTAAFFLRDVVLGTQHAAAVHFLLVALIAVATIVLYGRPQLGLLQLRAIEIALFGSTLVYIAIQDHAHVLAAAEAGEAGMALSRWNGSVLHVVLLMATYAIFIPNTWVRGAAVLVPMAATPPAVAGLVWVRHPELRSGLAPLATGEHLTDALLTLAIGTVVAVVGTMLINRFRGVAYEAREAGMYRLLEPIGSGGMGEVWVAEHRMLARPAAIKIVRPEVVGDGDEAAERAMRRFEREARSTAALRSPHTIDLYDFGITSDGIFYYAMEYLDGLDLETLVERHGPLPPERVVHLLLQVCDSLGDAHRRGFTHRDIKPANIYICRLGQHRDWVKVLDFGLVKEEEPDGDHPSLTAEGTTTGTPAFMAPEMALGKDDVDGRADLYALGCVGYWLLTGRLVFEADSAVATLVEHAKTPAPPPSSVTELEIPEELDRIVLRCLEKEPDDRFQTAEELAAALRAVELERAWDAERAAEWWDLHLPEGDARWAAA